MLKLYPFQGACRFTEAVGSGWWWKHNKALEASGLGCRVPLGYRRKWGPRGQNWQPVSTNHMARRDFVAGLMVCGAQFPKGDPGVSGPQQTWGARTGMSQ